MKRRLIITGRSRIPLTTGRLEGRGRRSVTAQRQCRQFLSAGQLALRDDAWFVLNVAFDSSSFSRAVYAVLLRLSKEGKLVPLGSSFHCEPLVAHTYARRVAVCKFKRIVARMYVFQTE